MIKHTIVIVSGERPERFSMRWLSARRLLCYFSMTSKSASRRQSRSPLSEKWGVEVTGPKDDEGKKTTEQEKKKREEKWEMLCVWEKERKKEYVFDLRWPQWRRWETSLHLPSSLHQSALPSLVFLCSLSLETSIFFRSQCKAEDVNALLVLELHWVISVVYAGLHNEYEFFKRRSVMPFSFPSVC